MMPTEIQVSIANQNKIKGVKIVKMRQTDKWKQTKILKNAMCVCMYTHTHVCAYTQTHRWAKTLWSFAKEHVSPPCAQSNKDFTELIKISSKI